MLKSTWFLLLALSASVNCESDSASSEIKHTQPRDIREGDAAESEPSNGDALSLASVLNDASSEASGFKQRKKATVATSSGMASPKESSTRRPAALQLALPDDSHETPIFSIKHRPAQKASKSSRSRHHQSTESESDSEQDTSESSESDSESHEEDSDSDENHGRSRHNRRGHRGGGHHRRGGSRRKHGGRFH